GMEPFEAGRAALAAGMAASNGSVMRCLPVALRYHANADRLVRVSAQQAAITHADERCTWGSVAVNLAARELLHGNRHFVEDVLHHLEGAAPRPLLEAIQRVPWEQERDLPVAVQGEYGYVVHCVEIAFWCALHRPALEEALIFLAEAGGGTGTKRAAAARGSAASPLGGGSRLAGWGAGGMGVCGARRRTRLLVRVAPAAPGRGADFAGGGGRRHRPHRCRGGGVGGGVSARLRQKD